MQEESMAEIYAMLGDADHAIPILQRLIKIPSFTAITPDAANQHHLGSDPQRSPFPELVAERTDEDKQRLTTIRF
jgi:hypothetical protein